MNYENIQNAIEAVNIKRGFTVRTFESETQGVSVVVMRDGLLYRRLWSSCPDFAAEFSHTLDRIAIPAEDIEPHSTSASKWTYNGSPVPAKIRIVTNGGMILVAACDAVMLNAIGGLRCNAWNMRLNLIDNRAYPADINPEHIKSVEYVQ